MERLTSRDAEILAALVLADGEWLTHDELFDVIGAWQKEPNDAIWRSFRRMRALGVEGLERGGGKPTLRNPHAVRTRERRPVGVRLTQIPPDWALDEVLCQVDRLRRRSGWRTSRRLRTA